MGKVIRQTIVRMMVPLLPLINLAALVFPLRQRSKKERIDSPHIS